MVIRGTTVTLLCREQGGTDEFNRPTWTERAVEVENVLIAPTASDAMTEETNLDGRKASYQLAIPKSDTNTWEGQRVRFWGAVWRVVGIPIRGIDELIPGPWNMKVQVERCE